jgi:hypothetical protein
MMSQQTIFVDREDRDSATKAATMIVRLRAARAAAPAGPTHARAR